MTLGDLERLTAEMHIRKKMADYCRGIDRADGELIRATFHDDAIEDHGEGFRGDPDGFVEFALNRGRDVLGAMHTLHQINVLELTSELARVETYCVAHRILPGPDVPILETLGIRYLDRFENRSDVGWRVAHRVIAYEWHAQQPLVGPELRRAGFAEPKRDRSDPSYQSAP
jgi:hypothetical protein